MLEKIFPRDELKRKFKKEISFVELGLSDFHTLKRDVPIKIHSLGLNIWDRIVQYQLKPVLPQAIANFVESEDPNICEEISRLIGEKVVKDLYYVKGEIKDPSLDRKTCAEFLTAHIYPNNIHLTDIEFSDPYKPLSMTERKYEFQDFAGLNLLGTLINNMVEVGKAVGCEYIVLSAAGVDLVPKFERHGFRVENTASGRQAMKDGVGPPMERKL